VKDGWVVFNAKLTKLGKRFIIIVPSDLHLMVQELHGKKMVVAVKPADEFKG